MTVLPNQGGGSSFKRAIAGIRADLAADDFLTVVIPEVLRSRSLLGVIRSPRTLRLKASFLFVRGVQVLDIPVVETDIKTPLEEVHEPTRNYGVVLAAGVHNALLAALEYAETLRLTDVRAVNFELNPDNPKSIGEEWLAKRVDVPLEIEDSPFRDIGRSLLQYVRQFQPDGIERVVTVIIPEFIVSSKRHQLLHGQSALLVKRHLLFEPGVTVASVPYHLD
jgi:hypothetical protein